MAPNITPEQTRVLKLIEDGGGRIRRLPGDVWRDSTGEWIQTSVATLRALAERGRLAETGQDEYVLVPWVYG